MGLMELEVLFVVVKDKELGEVCDLLVLSCCFPAHCNMNTMREEKHVFQRVRCSYSFLRFPSTLIHVIFFCCVANSNELWRHEIDAPSPRHG